MAKQPFTPEGLLSKQRELYALNDAELLLQAQVLSSDLKSFAGDHFNFSNSQLAYLSGMTGTAAFAIGCQLAAVLTVRGNITMDTVPENEDEPPRPKEIKPAMSGSIYYTNEDGGTLSSDLSVHISWELL